MSARARGALAVGLAVFAAGCAGHSNGTLPSTAVGAASGRHTIAARISVFVPDVKGRVLRRARGTRHQQYVSASSAGVRIVVYPSGTRSHAVASLVGDVATGSPACTPGAGGRDCTFTLNVKPSVRYDFVVTDYDEAPVDGSIPGDANVLGVGVATIMLAAGKANAVAVTLGGVVASLSFAALDAFDAIAPATQRATVAAFDADGNVIVSDGYVDSSGNAVNVTMSADSAGGTAIAFSPTTFSSPPADGIEVAYASSSATLAQMQNGFTTVLTATGSDSVGAASSTLTVQAPQTSQYDTPTAASEPVGIALGPDSAVWFVEQAASQIGRIDTSGTISEYPTVTANSQPRSIVAGSDGALWFTECAGNNIGRIPTYATPGSSAQVKEYPVTPAASAPQGIAAAASGELWFAQCAPGANAIVSMNVEGVQGTSAAVPTAASASTAIAVDANGAVWFAESSAGANKIGRMTAAGTFTEFAIPTAGSVPSGIAAGPDAAMWFTECAGSKIGRIPIDATTAAQITEYPTPTSNAGPVGIALGPDGALWFTERTANQIGRIVTTATNGSSAQILEFSAAGSPTGIVAGDASLWYTQAAGNAIGRLQ